MGRLKALEVNLNATMGELQDKFESGKESTLKAKANIRAALTEYKNLNLGSLLASHAVEPEVSKYASSQLLGELDKLKSLPSEIVHPEEVVAFTVDLEFLDEIKQALSRITSPATVAEQVKNKIETDVDFFKRGAFLYQKTLEEHCPFCDQNLASQDAKDLLDAYISYFNDEEQKHKEQLGNLSSGIERIRQSVLQLELRLKKRKILFDELRAYIPSKKGSNLTDCSEDIEKLGAELDSIAQFLQEKYKDPSKSLNLSSSQLDAILMVFQTKILQNNKLAVELSVSANSTDKERKNIQRVLCKNFEIDFARKNWALIEQVREFQSKILEKEVEKQELLKGQIPEAAKERVADTFEVLLGQFFGAKYKFSRDSFTLTRGNDPMTRGTHRTLSDGEKSVLAFCYFLACIHKKVSDNLDYKKLFLVFDDPVTSMSYDHVFSIAQTLKNLRIYDDGRIEIKSSSGTD